MLPRMSVSMDHAKGENDVEPKGEGTERLASAHLQSLRAGGSTSQDNKVRINVGGVRHETYKSTLKSIPDTRLAWLAQSTATNSTDYDPTTGEFFFDRHPRMFDAVLNYYRVGKLHAPRDVCGPAFEEELQFWGIDEKQIEACCWSYHTEHRDAQETLAKLNGPNYEKSDSEEEEDVARIFGIEEEYETAKKSWYRRYQPRVWAMLDEPYSSRAAKVFAFASLLFVVLSITTFCLETMSNFRTTINGTDDSADTIETHISLFIIESVCVTFFTVELLVRFIFCPNKLRFFITVENVVDIVAVIPFYVDLGERINGAQTSQFWDDFLSFLRIVRIFRIFKLARHLSGLKILVHTVQASAKELLLTIVFVTLVTLVSASLIYYAEKWTQLEGVSNDFTDIPVGFWWVVVTITTVGYGDVVPRSWLGRVIGACTAIIGVLTLALPIPVIVNNFSLYYTHAQASQKLPKKRKRVLVGAADVLKTQGNHMTSSSISGYSTQSTNEYDTYSLRSEDSGLRTVSGVVTANGSVKMASSAVGEKTQISVYFTDEVSESPFRARSPMSPSFGAAGGLSPSQQRRVGKRASLMPSGHVGGLGRRESFAPNGAVPRQNGRSRSFTGGALRPPPRRRSLLPSMTEVDV